MGALPLSWPKHNHSMSSRDRQSLEDMLSAARKIIAYAQGTTQENLPSVPMRLDAVLYEIVVLGEAARRLSQDIRSAHPEIPWREIIAMRSVITHGYDQIDNQELWQVIERDLPDLMPKLQAVLAVVP
jgi:uncharacterized protein with HEPN domain